MRSRLNSAGLVYFYLCGFLEEDQIELEVVNSSQSLPSGFYEQVCQHLLINDAIPNTVHIFGIIGAPEKVEKNLPS